MLALFVSLADPEIVLPTLELLEDALPALSPVSGNPPVVVVSFATSAGFLPTYKAKNPAASIMMIMAVIMIFVVADFIFLKLVPILYVLIHVLFKLL